jgi:hypothetical protein
MKYVCVMANNLLKTGAESISKTWFISDILRQEEMSNTMKYSEMVGNMTWNFSTIMSEWKKKILEQNVDTTALY